MLFVTIRKDGHLPVVPPSLVSERDLLVAAVMLNREVDKTCEGEESPPRGRGRNGEAASMP